MGAIARRYNVMEPNRGGDQRLLASIHIQNLLSFSAATAPLALEGLNVFVGPNASGKSNLIEALVLMRSTPVSPTGAANDLQALLREGGGGSEWVWKGGGAPEISIELHWANWIRHVIKLLPWWSKAGLQVEVIESAPGPNGPDFAYRNDRSGGPRILKGDSHGWRELPEIKPDFSVLAQLRDPTAYPAFAILAASYDRIRIYREWSFGRNTIFRQPQRADMRNDRLEEDFSNLGLFLSRLGRHPKAKARLLASLKDLYEGIHDYQVVVEGGSVQVFFTEGEFSIPATRLSDGTLRYLCLLAILCDPEPPPLICIEEPELGLHPDILPKLADLLVEASERTQLIVTTHSDVLVDAMTERPECVVVCEKHEGSTVMKRLNRDDLSQWLEKYRLGQLWLSGQIGGTRW